MSHDPTEPVRNAPISQDRRPCLLVQTSSGVELAAQRWPLEGPIFRVGRAQDNHLVIPDKSVSREHARFELHDGRWWVRSLQPGTNPVLLRGTPVHDAAPLASTDLISIGVVMLQFVEPESQAIEETLPFPLAFALRQVDTAGSSERRLRAAQLGIELVLRFVFAAQVGALLPVEAGALVRRLLRGLQFNRAVSMGAWVELVCRLAPAFEQDPGPLGVALRALFQGAGGAGALQQRITRQVELRNDLSHRWFGEEDAYENEAQQAVGELRTLVQALVPLRATTLFGWLPSDGGPNPATQQGWPVRVMRGASLQFPLRSLPLMQPLEAGWCYLVDDRQRVLPLAPFFALLTSQQTRRLDLFISRTFPLLAAGAPTQVDGLTCGHGAEVPFPTSPLLRSLMG